MKTAFDLGMYDASDTRYLLESGFRVVALEANPTLLEAARLSLAAYVASGQLELVGAALSEDEKPVELTVCGEDTGSSSIYETRVSGRMPLGKYSVEAVTMADLLARFGTPHYLKVDLEGADRLAVLALTSSNRPQFLSFELGEDAEELIDHCAAAGFTRFKMINQCSFREVSREDGIRDRLAGKIVRLLGYAEPQYLRRGSRLFRIGHSSGPAPWCSDGDWSSHQAMIGKWRGAQASRTGNVWYDLHAS